MDLNDTIQKKKRVIALGFFDGVHRGHGALLRRAVERAREYGPEGEAVAFTFDRHPASQILGHQIPLLSTPQDRKGLMERCYGIHDVVVGQFDRMMRMPWRAFVTDYLQKELGVVHVVAGHDFHFGYRGEGNPARLQALCAQVGLGCDIIQRVELDGITVSSTYIRTLVAQGEMERAMEFLGHPHTFSGPVVHGKQLGRTIGFPTANLVVPPEILVPAHGVYATKVVTPDGVSHMAVTNVGVRPTVDDGDQLTVEPWILDFDGDLYGQNIRVEYYGRIRGEQKFDSLQALSDMVHKNARETRVYFSQLEGRSHSGR